MWRGRDLEVVRFDSAEPYRLNCYRRNHLDLQINLLAENEVTKMLQLIYALNEKVPGDKINQDMEYWLTRHPSMSLRRNSNGGELRSIARLLMRSHLDTGRCVRFRPVHKSHWQRSGRMVYPARSIYEGSRSAPVLLLS
jgi:hypothetical protein